MTTESEKQQPSSAGTKYLNRLREAETRHSAAYWNFRFICHFLGEIPGILWDELKTWVRWRTKLFTGSIEARDEPCQFKDCRAQSVALLPNGKSYSDGTAACRRHFLAMKAVFYTVILTVSGLVGVSIWAVMP